MARVGLGLGLGLGSGVGGAAAPVGNSFTWNPSDKSADITLSGGNLFAIRAASNDGVWRSVRSTAELANGQYVEIAFNTPTLASNIIFGVSDLTAVTSTYVGADTHGWGYNGANGNKFTNGGSSAYGNTLSGNDVIGIAYKDGKLWFAKNNTWQASGNPVAGTNAAFTGLASTGIYVTASLFDSTNNITLRVAAASLSYAPPAGFFTAL